MKYFYDTEFIEDGITIDLISIGIVAEDGREYYAINKDCDFSKASDWVVENVLTPIGISKSGLYIDKELICNLLRVCYDIEPVLDEKNYMMSKKDIKQNILEFCDPIKYGNPEFWGYYADYDHVVFCQLFGKMIDLPENYPMYTKDLKQLLDDCYIKGYILPDNSNEHNALSDAKWIKLVYDQIMYMYNFSNPLYLK